MLDSLRGKLHLDFHVHLLSLLGTVATITPVEKLLPKAGHCHNKTCNQRLLPQKAAVERTCVTGVTALNACEVTAKHYGSSFTCDNPESRPHTRNSKTEGG